MGRNYFGVSFSPQYTIDKALEFRWLPVRKKSQARWASAASLEEQALRSSFTGLFLAQPCTLCPAAVQPVHVSKRQALGFLLTALLAHPAECCVLSAGSEGGAAACGAFWVRVLASALPHLGWGERGLLPPCSQRLNGFLLIHLDCLVSAELGRELTSTHCPLGKRL